MNIWGKVVKFKGDSHTLDVGNSNWKFKNGHLPGPGRNSAGMIYFLAFSIRKTSSKDDKTSGNILKPDPRGSSYLLYILHWGIFSYSVSMSTLYASRSIMQYDRWPQYVHFSLMSIVKYLASFSLMLCLQKLKYCFIWSSR